MKTNFVQSTIFSHVDAAAELFGVSIWDIKKVKIWWRVCLIVGKNFSRFVSRREFFCKLKEIFTFSVKCHSWYPRTVPYHQPENQPEKKEEKFTMPKTTDSYVFKQIKEANQKMPAGNNKFYIKLVQFKSIRNFTLQLVVNNELLGEYKGGTIEGFIEFSNLYCRKMGYPTGKCKSSLNSFEDFVSCAHNYKLKVYGCRRLS